MNPSKKGGKIRVAKLLLMNMYPSYRPVVSSNLRDGEFLFLYTGLLHNI